jgi:ubiquinone/menaquinone biosynthesis C-methylase UbiE
MDPNSFYRNVRYAHEVSEFRAMPLQPRLKVVLNHLVQTRPAGKKILDIGAGRGEILTALQRRWEIDANAIELAPAHIRLLQARHIPTISLDVSSERLPYPAHTFDICIMTEIIEHVFDCQHALNEVYRVLKRGGQLYLTTHNSFNGWMRMKYLTGNIPAVALDVSGPTMGEHIRLFNEKNLFRLLANAGFTMIQKRHFLQLPGQLILNTAIAPFFSTHLFAVATK